MIERDTQAGSDGESDAQSVIHHSLIDGYRDM